VVDDPDMHTYFALYVGVIPIPVGFFFKEPEAQLWAERFHAGSAFEIRPFAFRWPPDSYDERGRPTVFLATFDI
jgi:hypothetical protein